MLLAVPSTILLLLLLLPALFQEETEAPDTEAPDTVKNNNGRMPCLNHYRWWYRCRRYIGFVCVERIDATTTSPSGGCGDVGWPLETRARIARGWLRRLGIADKMVSVAPGSRSKRAIRTTKEEEEEVEEEEEEEDSTCYIPKATHLTVQEATLYGTNETAAGAKLILAMVRQHAEKLEIIVMGKLTTLHTCTSAQGRHWFTCLSKRY